MTQTDAGSSEGVAPLHPAHRIRIEPSEAHVKVSLGGVVLAESDRAVELHEGKLPIRYYFPPDDVRTDLLVDSDARTRCPWKGEASYRSLVLDGKTFEDLVWTYPDPIPGAEPIRGLLCFYNEKVDIEVDPTRPPGRLHGRHRDPRRW